MRNLESFGERIGMGLFLLILVMTLFSGTASLLVVVGKLVV